MFSLFKILFLLASFLPLIFADCTSGVIMNVDNSITYDSSVKLPCYDTLPTKVRSFSLLLD